MDVSFAEKNHFIPDINYHRAFSAKVARSDAFK